MKGQNINPKPCKRLQCLPQNSHQRHNTLMVQTGVLSLTIYIYFLIALVSLGKALHINKITLKSLQLNADFLLARSVYPGRQGQARG